jgi:hypothetical protein
MHAYNIIYSHSLNYCSPLRWLLDVTQLSVLRTYPMCSAPLTPPVAVSDVGMAAACTALAHAIASTASAAETNGNGGNGGSQRVVLASLLDDAASKHHKTSDVIAYDLPSDALPPALIAPTTSTTTSTTTTSTSATNVPGGGKVYVLEFEGIEAVAALGREIASKRTNM